MWLPAERNATADTHACPAGNACILISGNVRAVLKQHCKSTLETAASRSSANTEICVSGHVF